MSTTWEDSRIFYTVAGEKTVILAIGAGGVDENALDLAIQAFADTYNGSYEVTSVSKAYEGTGVSDWTYSP